MARIPDDELAFERSGDPKRGAHYRHARTGGLYVVECVALDAADPTVRTVVYREYGTRRYWTRPVSEFVDGRFTEVSE